MLEEHNSGTSINIQELSDLDTTTNPSISIALEREPTCKSTVPAPTGGRSSSTRDLTSPTSITRRLLVSRTDKTKKLKLFNHKIEVDTFPRDGESFTLIRWAIKLTERRDK